MRVIPAIDLLDGQVVRLHKGDYDSVTVYNDNPVEQAQTFKQADFDHLHIVDLNGARDGKFVNLKWIRRIIDELDLSVQTGGGVRSYDDVKKLVDAGLSGIVCSSMPVQKPADWQKALDEHPDRMILGMDLKGGKLAYAGWTKTAKETPESILTKMQQNGLQEVLCTDISRDGTLAGANVKLYQNLMTQFPDIRFIASGGVSGKEDLIKLNKANVDAVVVGRAYYESKLSLETMRSLHQS